MNRKVILISTAALICLLFAVVVGTLQLVRETSPRFDPFQMTDLELAAGVGTDNAGAAQPRTTPVRANAPEAMIAELLTCDPASMADNLAATRSLFLSLPRAEASRLLLQILSTGCDQQLGGELGFDGDEFIAPTLRTWFIELLLQVDPVAAAKYVREHVLSIHGSVDEWAIGLRAVGQAEGTASFEFLRNKATELVLDTRWKSEPSAGYFEAFDIFVHTESWTSIPMLAGLVETNSPEWLPQAAILAIDRLVIRQPEEALKHLLEAPKLMKDWPETRANLFARLNIANDAQRHILVKYIDALPDTGAEVRAFAEVFPLDGVMHSDNLLSDPQVNARLTYSPPDLPVMRRIITEWERKSQWPNKAWLLREMRANIDEML